MIPVNWKCEKCERVFVNRYECMVHEESCGVKKKFTCGKCGKTTEYSSDPTGNEWMLDNQCHLLKTGVSVGYGSKLDGCNIEIPLCDDCLFKMVESLTTEAKLKIYESSGEI